MPSPLFSTSPSAHFNLTGPVGRLLQAVTDQWLLVAPLANPTMLEMFASRDIPPYRNLMPWAGEFAGKYLTSAVLVYRTTRDERLKAWLAQFVERLIQFQDADGYLGPWPSDCRLTNFSPYHHLPEGMPTWDTWGHYHLMTGLLFWFEETADPRALDCACRMAVLICQKYLGQPTVRLVDTSWPEMNLSPVHALARLYRITAAPRYLEMALQIVDEFAAQGPDGPLAGDYLNQALAGKAMYEMPRPRWESSHSILGLAELFWITGEARFKRAFEQIWWSIVEFDRHNNGGFSSGEQATGNPYHQGTIETCCTIAWVALSVEMLRLTGSSIVADEIELSSLNSVMGMHSATGRWSTFTTPMDGARFASAHAIVFQSRSGSPELNCCSVNSPRGLGMLSEWAVMLDPSGLVLNYYGPSDLRLPLPDGQLVDICQETDYPISNRIKIMITPTQPASFTLSLRIPSWSQKTRLSFNQQPLEGVRAGQYYPIRRQWQPDDLLELELDFSPHFWRGEKECQDLVSIFRGPLLLAYDQRYNPALAPARQEAPIPDDVFKVVRDLLPVPSLDASQSSLDLLEWQDWHAPILLVEARTAQGQLVRLCDFASAGATGTLYRSWLPVTHAPAFAPFTRQNPQRSAR